MAPSETICASPLSDCSSSRSFPPSPSQSRPVAPLSSGPPPSRLDESMSLLVKEMFAVIPVTSGAVTASWTARASGLAGGTGPPFVAARAIAAPPAITTTTAVISARRRPVGGGRSRLMAVKVRTELERSLTPLGGYARRVAEPAYYDEVFAEDGAPRPHYRGAMEALEAADLAELAEELRAEVRERGVRYGDTGPGEFVVDAVPRLFPAREWEELVRGLSQ